MANARARKIATVSDRCRTCSPVYVLAAVTVVIVAESAHHCTSWPLLVIAAERACHCTSSPLLVITTERARHCKSSLLLVLAAVSARRC
jgi:hypothetical protein